MSYKTPVRQLINLCELIENTTKVKLLGVEALSECSDRELARLAKSGKLNRNINCFSTQLEVGDEFYYAIEARKLNATFATEIGLGYLVKEGDDYYVNRMLPMFYIDDDGVKHDAVAQLSMFYEFAGKEGFYFVITNYTPSNVKEFFFRDSCLMTSHAPFIPTALCVEKDCIVGRDGLNQLDNMPLKNLHNNTNFSYSVMQSLVKESKQIVLRSSQLDVKKLKTSQVLLKPSNKAVEQTGTIFYNSDLGKIQVYDGTSWRNLVYEDT